MTTRHEAIREQLGRFGQAQLLEHCARLDEPARQRLLEQAAAIDLEQLQTLFRQRDKVYKAPTADHIRPPLVIDADQRAADSRALGDQLIAEGAVAALVVAGGQGSRLGFEHPKGMYAIGPVSQRSLFQIHAEKILALERRFGAAIQFLVMTSPATHDETRQFFQSQNFFGLSDANVHFFCQGVMPAVDWETGALLLEAPGRLFLSPDGHGGMLTALASSGLLAKLRAKGIKYLFYFQVDNPLVKVADPTFLGLHAGHAAEVSSKIVPKEGPRDKLGNVVLIDGRCSIIEYSDLPEDLGERRGPDGKLWIGAGSPAIHIFDLEFLERMSRQGVRIPFHIARKKVPYLDASGHVVQPETENALKFERFIFDLLPLAERWTVVATSRHEEFMPLKNGTGPDSPATVRQALSNLYWDWLKRAGVKLPWQENEDVPIPVEISPLFALDAAELAARLPKGWRLENGATSCCMQSSWQAAAAPGSGLEAGRAGPSSS
jgi:UDP-N-acetylglucosamine/UDP-N-acetylgalactosamine diphosphorylase